MNTLSAFPKEILRLIFFYLKKEYGKDVDLAQCALTYRAWRQAAQETLFHALVIWRNKQLGNVVDVLEKSPSLKRLVKVVRYYHIPDPVENHNVNLIIINEAFPLLEELYYCMPDMTLLLTLHLLLLAGKFPYLSKLHVAPTKDTVDIYVTCIKYMKDRISSIELCEDIKNEINTYEILSTQLDQYPKLVSVTFNIQSSVQKSIKNYLDLLDTMTTSVKKVELSSNLKAITKKDHSDVVQPIPHLKELSIRFNETILPGHDKNILYLMKKFPSLHSFQLHARDCSSPIILRESTPHCKNLHEKFFDYVSDILNHSIHGVVTDISDAGQLLHCYLEKN